MDNWWIRWADAWARILAELWMVKQKRKAESNSGETSNDAKESDELNGGMNAMSSLNKEVK